MCEACTRTSAIIVLTTLALAGRHLAVESALSTLPLALVPVGMTLTTIPAAQFMRRRGRRPGFVTAALLGVTGATTCAFAAGNGWFPLLCVGAFVIGTANGFATYYRFAAAEVSEPEFRSRAISLVMAGGVVAAVAGSTLATATVDFFPERPFTGSFACIGAAQALLLIVLVFVRLPVPSEAASLERGRPLRQIVSNPTFLMAVLGALSSWGVMSLLMNVTPLSMDRQTHSFRDTASVIQWHVLGMYVPSFFTGHLIRWLGERTIMFAGVALLATAAWLNLAGTAVANYMAGLAVLGVGWNFLFISCTSILIGTYRGEGEKARVQSMNDFFIFVTMILTTFWAGPLEARVGWHELNRLVLGVVGAVALLMVALRVREGDSQLLKSP
ncbi:MAG: MFS transporter [Candidatus Latescibacterota bacterium]|nr:MFS transporter [Candidatus Latescibacterota bacterium]